MPDIGRPKNTPWNFFILLFKVVDLVVVVIGIFKDIDEKYSAFEFI